MFCLPIDVSQCEVKTIKVKEMLINVVKVNALGFKDSIDRANVNINLLSYKPGTESGKLHVVK